MHVLSKNIHIPLLIMGTFNTGRADALFEQVKERERERNRNQRRRSQEGSSDHHHHHHKHHHHKHGSGDDDKQYYEKLYFEPIPGACC